MVDFSQHTTERRITVGTKQITLPKDGIDVSNVPIKVTTAGIALEVPATTLKFEIEPGKALEDALRPFIHEKIRNLPSHHFLGIEAVANAKGEFDGFWVTIIIPEAK